MSDGTARLVHMANQIATAFRTESQAAAAQATCDHIVHFWDPEMRRKLVALSGQGGTGLNEIARAAALILGATDDAPLGAV